MDEKSNLKLNSKKLIFQYILILALAVVMEVLVTVNVLNQNNQQSTARLLEQVENSIKNNDSQEKEQLDDLKQSYIITASAASYIIDNKPEIINDTQELRNAAALLNVDEIHIFDESGTIIAGTNPEYIGFSFSSGEQMGYFKPMLKNKTLSMCQDVTPNTAEGKSMMYAITWNNSGRYMIQIGVEPKRLLEMLKDHRIENVINGIPLSKGFEIFSVDPETDIISSSTNESMIGSKFKTIRLLIGHIDTSLSTPSTYFICKGRLYYCNYKQIDDTIIVSAYKFGSNVNILIASVLVISAYLVLAGIAIFMLFIKLQSTEEKKNEDLQKYVEEMTELNRSLKENSDLIMKQYHVLESISKVYYSMHLIDLTTDTFEEFTSHGRVKELVNKSTGAALMMRQVMEDTITDEYREAALEFTDLTTVADRMGERKIITTEMIGKNIGWFLATFIVVEADENSRPIKVIYTTTGIDEDKKREEKLIKKSNTDELTGTGNRRAYEEEIERLTQDGPDDDFAYISLDVNELKVINDKFGHEAGDELIIGACRCIRGAVGCYGRLYRTGGDEFIALINADSDAIENIKKQLDENMQEWQGNFVDSLSVSYGIVTKAECPSAQIHEIAMLADQRMYESKTRYYRRKGIDRRGQKDAHVALCNLYTKILKINLTDDSYQIVNMDEAEKVADKGFSDSISEWLSSFGKTGQVHPDDLDEYLRLTDLKYMKEYFRGAKTSLHIFYRRMYEDGFKQTMMEIIPANDYSSSNQSLYLYVKDIDK